jgi:tetratricopeptide (TPR) repeat protein
MLSQRGDAMAYVRKKGNQIALVQGERDPDTGTVNQKTLFTFFSKAEAYRAIGKSKRDDSHYFQNLLQDEHPTIKFDWKKINEGIADKLNVLPDLAEYQEQRLAANFKSSLHAFARELIQTDPQSLIPSSKLLQEHKDQLEFLRDVIDMKLDSIDTTENDFNSDNEFYWRQTLRGWGINPDVEEVASDFYRSGDYESAISAFTLLTDSFPNYAEGHNYLGLIHLDLGNLEESIAHFRKSVELGRKMFPKRMRKDLFWSDHKTRPYMRGLNNLIVALNRSNLHEDALTFCDTLANECGDKNSASSHRTSIFLNTGRWIEAEDCAVKTMEFSPLDAVLVAFAQFEQGKYSEAKTNFLHAAFNNPLGVQILVQGKAVKPKDAVAIEDYNAGIDTSNGINPYLLNRNSKSKSFFNSILRHPDIKILVDEAYSCSTNHSKIKNPEEHHNNFSRWLELKNMNFAENVAKTISHGDSRD